MATSRELPAIAEIAITEIDACVIEELLRQLRTRHHLDGALVTWKHPVFMMRVPGKEAKRSTNEFNLRITPIARTGVFGSSLDLEVHYTATNERSRVCVAAKHSAFMSLQAGLCYVVLSDGGKPATAVFVDFSKNRLGDSFANVWSAIAEHLPLVMDQDAHYWETLSQVQHLSHSLSATDRLSIGWANTYSARIVDLHEQFTKLATMSPFVCSLDGLQPECLRNMLSALRSHDYDLLRTFETFRLARLDGKQLGYCYHSTFDLSDNPNLKEYEHPLREFCEALSWSSWFSDCGKRFPWMDSLSPVGEVRTFEIVPHEFPEWFSPEDYWKRAIWDFKYELGRMLTGSDVPVGLGEWNENQSQFPRASEIEEVATLAANLLDDAVEHKTWTIPPRAVVQQPIGIFTHLELHEFGGNVFCILRTAKGEFYASAVNPLRHHGTFVVPLRIEQDAETKRAIEAGVHLIICAIIRDFWVVEEREKVFRVERQSFRQGRRQETDDKPRVIYLPRIKYTDKPNPMVATQELGYPERRTHNVVPHLRRAGSASGSQLILAERYGFDVPMGFTFVRPHLRGKGQNEVIYKSRSALQSLYMTDVGVAGETKSIDWFQFERDVYDLMAGLGFLVKHVAASRHGDNGVDIYATKGSDFDRVNWVIQCKCWKPSRKVYPSTIRELCGVLSEQPHGTRGMVVTTSSFSSGSRAQAHTADIRLVDGEEFTRLIQANPPR